MEEILNNFRNQFLFSPQIINTNKFKIKKKIVIIGLGGSHLAGDLLKITHNHLDLTTIADFCLPTNINFQKTSFILISYSGNTQETINIFKEIKKRTGNFLIISANGFLLQQAKINKYPYIEIPEKNIPPRLATVYIYLSLLKVLKDQLTINKIKKLNQLINFKKIKNQALTLSFQLQNKIPIIYSSFNNYPLAYNFKIRFNETSKIPSFCNYLPEINHNEIQGWSFDKKIFYSQFIFILLQDKNEPKEILTSFTNLKKLLTINKFEVINLFLNGNNLYEKIFSALHLADWLSFYLAEIYKVQPVATPFIDYLKKQYKN
jgi:glucose/mannose-6-phosphate isomerase